MKSKLNELIDEKLRELDLTAHVANEEYGFDGLLDFWFKLKNACEKRIDDYKKVKGVLG